MSLSSRDQALDHLLQEAKVVLEETKARPLEAIDTVMAELKASAYRAVAEAMMNLDGNLVKNSASVLDEARKLALPTN